MSNDWKDAIARRPLLTALGALIGIGAVGGIAYESSGLLGLRARKGAYEDLLSRLQDRDGAVLLGKAELAGNRAMDAKEIALRLRQKLGQQPLSTVLTQDALQGRVVEIQGWVVPETLAGLCALASKVA